MMSVERQEDTYMETVTEVSKAPSAVFITKRNESPAKRKMSELPELKAKS